MVILSLADKLTLLLFVELYVTTLAETEMDDIGSLTPFLKTITLPLGVLLNVKLV